MEAARERGQAARPVRTRREVRPIRLDGEYQKSSVAIVGLAFMGLGVFAVFKTESEAGPVAILLLGFLLLVIGLAGQLPSYFKFGEYEIALEAKEAFEDFVEDSIDRAPADQRPAILLQMAELAQQAPELAGTAVVNLVNEAATIASLRLALAKDFEDIDVHEGPRQGPFDLIVTDLRTDRKFAIEVLGGRASRYRLLQLRQRFNHVREEQKLSHLIVVTRQPPNPADMAYFNELGYYSIVPNPLAAEDPDPVVTSLAKLMGPRTSSTG